MTINIPISTLHGNIEVLDQDYKEDEYESFLLIRVIITNKIDFE